MTSGTKSLGGINAQPVPLSGQFYGSQSAPTDVYLGEARTDAEGRLVVLAGRGLSRSIADKNVPYPLILTDFDSPDWIDDTSDGWVLARVTHISSGKTYGRLPAFLIYALCAHSLHDAASWSRTRLASSARRPSSQRVSMPPRRCTISWKTCMSRRSAPRQATSTTTSVRWGGTATSGPSSSALRS